MEPRGEELAWLTLDYIRENPGEWDQETYFCGSTACFAGRAILLAGKNQPYPFWEEDSQSDLGSPGELARELLGWTRNQAYAVFMCFTTDFTILEEKVKRVLNGEIT